MTVRFRNIIRALIPLGMAGFVLLGSTPSAHALLTLSAVQDGGVATLTVFDNGPGDTNPAIGILALGSTTVPITFGDFLVLGSVSTSNSPGGLLDQLKSNSLSVTNTTGTSHSVVFKVSDTGFTTPLTPSPTFDAAGSGQWDVDVDPITHLPLATSVSGSSAHVLAFVDFTNTLFGTQNKIQDFSKAAGTGTTDSYSNTVTGVVAGTPTASPYSMTVELDHTLAGHNVLSSRGNSITGVQAVPEPATLLSMAVGLPLLGLGAWVRRRRRSS